MYRSFCDHCKSLYSKSRLLSGGITGDSDSVELILSRFSDDVDVAGVESAFSYACLNREMSVIQVFFRQVSEGNLAFHGESIYTDCLATLVDGLYLDEVAGFLEVCRSVDCGVDLGRIEGLIDQKEMSVERLRAVLSE